VTFNPIFFLLFRIFFFLTSCCRHCELLRKLYSYVFYSFVSVVSDRGKFTCSIGGENVPIFDRACKSFGYPDFWGGGGKCVPHLSYYLLQLFSSCKLCKLVSYFKCDTMWYYCRAIFSAECNLSSTYSTPGRVRRFLDCSIRHGECLGIGHKGWKKPTVPSVFLGSEHKLYIVNGGKLALY